MNTLKELIEKATPLPWSFETGEHCCFHAGNRVSIIRWSKDGPDENNCETVAEVWPTSGDSDIADGALIAHCVNNFAQVMEALERSHEVIKDLASAYSDDATFDEKNGGYGAGTMSINERVIRAAQTIPPGEKEAK